MELRHIVFLGEPVTGKTTVAKAVVERLPNSVFVEATEAGAGGLPPRARRLARKLRAALKHGRTPAARAAIRSVFDKLYRAYGLSVIGKAIHRFVTRRYPRRRAVVSGVRHPANARYLKQRGYLIVFLKARRETLLKRYMERTGYSRAAAVRELEEERRQYHTPSVERRADLVFDTSRQTPGMIVDAIVEAVGAREARECRRCVNTARNPSLAFTRDGYCSVCAMYLRYLDRRALARERRWFLAQRGATAPYDIMVGFSGGKDSTALLATVKRLGFRPLAFTFDTGYYPRHIFGRARRIARELGVGHERTDIRKYMTPADRASYRMMADLYGEPETPALAERFRRLYAEGRRRYSVRDRRPFPFVRSCQACRKPVIRAYYAEALRHGVRVVALGMNEWAGLSQIHSGRKPVISAIRKLQPFRHKPAVYVVHVPFLLRQRLADTRRILRRLGWRVPRGEEMVESNANSCLLARAANEKARRLLGFHPDSTRLAREVAVGFLTKEQARRALEKRVRPRTSVRQVLRRARIVR